MLHFHNFTSQHHPIFIADSIHLCVVQKWGSLLVCWNHSALSVTPETDLLAKDARNGNNEGREEENPHNDKGKDPLEGKCFGEELSNSEGCSKDTESKANGVVL